MIQTIDGLTPMERSEQRYHITWRCDKAGMDMMRPRGNALSEGCGRFAYKSTKWDVRTITVGQRPDADLKEYPMGQCTCGRKVRLNPNNRRLKFHNSRQEAIEYCKDLNEALGLEEEE